MKGRKPTPINLKKLMGNPGKRALGNAPTPQVKIPARPKGMAGEALAEWKRITTELEKAGLVTTIDRAALVQYCEAWADWTTARAHLKAEGLMLKTEKGNWQHNPWVGVEKRAAATIQRMLTEFGMTPSARSRLSVGGGDQESEFQAFQRGAGGEAG